MNRRFLTRASLLLASPMIWPTALAPMARAAAPEDSHAVVVSTQTLPIHSCPDTSCPVQTRAALGDEVTITGQPQDGFTPVSYGETRGFASPFFLAADPADPPFLVGGTPGCQRVAFLFNVGVGFEPDTGILDTLEANQVPAMMFVMGWWADEDPPILQRMVAAGYPIASHGYDAIELTTRTDDEVYDDIVHAAATIEQMTGTAAAPFFTPYAAAIDDRVRSIVAGQGLLPVAWEVPAADYGPDATEASVYSRVMDNMHDGAIVEFHLDAEFSKESTGRALPRIIADLRQQGYQFVTIPEMMEPC